MEVARAFAPLRMKILKKEALRHRQHPQDSPSLILPADTSAFINSGNLAKVVTARGATLRESTLSEVERVWIWHPAPNQIACEASSPRGGGRRSEAKELNENKSFLFFLILLSDH